MIVNERWKEDKRQGRHQCIETQFRAHSASLTLNGPAQTFCIGSVRRLRNRDASMFLQATSIYCRFRIQPHEPAYALIGSRLSHSVHIFFNRAAATTLWILLKSDAIAASMKASISRLLRKSAAAMALLEVRPDL